MAMDVTMSEAPLIGPRSLRHHIRECFSRLMALDSKQEELLKSTPPVPVVTNKYRKQNKYGSFTTAANINTDTDASTPETKRDQLQFLREEYYSEAVALRTLIDQIPDILPAVKRRCLREILVRLNKMLEEMYSEWQDATAGSETHGSMNQLRLAMSRHRQVMFQFFCLFNDFKSKL
ncbi:hypothetical protein BGX33_006077 [Mortierella sp. NVP41]|nr:hypothetical protein BGX33_006077 [Mortierella sp. NVP41]